MTSTTPLPRAESPPNDPVPSSGHMDVVTDAPQKASSIHSKPIHSLVLDTGPLIKGDPAISTLLARAEELYTIPAVLDEIRDEQTRSRMNTTLLPFLKLRSPRPESIKFVCDFARRTGDFEVLSRPDIQLIALTYELEIERNGGDWRLRNEPNQKRVNGSAPKREDVAVDTPSQEAETPVEPLPETSSEEPAKAEEASTVGNQPAETAEATPAGSTKAPGDSSEASQDPALLVAADLQKLDLEPERQAQQAPEAPEDGSDDSDGEWITPSNIKKHQAKDHPALAPEPIQRILQACILTSDFAMQNVAMRINLNVVSPTLARITQLKSWVLRCHGCFAVTRKMDKQFCPSCGQSTLTRVSCSTDSSGNFKIHLKRNFQWNNRGNVFSIPKPVHGNASGKKPAATHGGGKNGWGRELILAEDQKEYQRKVEDDRRARVRDLMDEDYLPGILTGDRIGGNGKIKVGAGRNVNAKKRR